MSSMLEKHYEQKRHPIAPGTGRDEDFRLSDAARNQESLELAATLPWLDGLAFLIASRYPDDVI